MSPSPTAPNSLPALFRRAENLAPVRCAMVHPCDHASLEGIIAAAQHQLVIPVLIGPKAKIEAVAAEHGFDISGFELIDEPFSHAAAERASHRRAGRRRHPGRAPARHARAQGLLRQRQHHHRA